MRAKTRVGVLVLSEACGNRADTFLSLGLVLATLSLNDLCVSHYAAHTEEVSSSNPVSTMLITVTTSSECMPARSARIPDLNNPPNMSQTFRGQGHIFFYLWTFILDLSYLWRPLVLGLVANVSISGTNESHSISVKAMMSFNTGQSYKLRLAQKGTKRPRLTFQAS